MRHGSKVVWIAMVVLGMSCGAVMGGELPTPSTPAIVMGFPKSGTSSMLEYFRCGGVSARHYECTESRPPKYCSECVYTSIEHGRPPLADCPSNVSAWCQLDSTFAPNGPKRTFGTFNPETHFEVQGAACFWPQVHALPQFATAYPKATWILTQRPAEHWIKSVTNWNTLRTRMIRCNISNILKPFSTDEDFATFLK